MIETKKQAIEKLSALIKDIQKQTDPDRERKVKKTVVIEERVTDIIDTIINEAVKEAEKRLNFRMLQHINHRHANDKLVNEATEQMKEIFKDSPLNKEKK